MAAFLLDLFAALVYPGMLTALLVGLVAGRLLEGPASGGRAIRGLIDAIVGHASLAYAGAVVLALLALTRLPWPNPSWLCRGVACSVSTDPAEPWLLWALVEGSVIAATLPGLAFSMPAMSRVAVRDAQLGVGGRLVMWIGVAVALRVRGTPELASGYPLSITLAVAALGVLLAIPAAAGWPPFGYEPFGNASRDGSLPDEDAALVRWARRLLSVFWLALFAMVFIPLPPLPWWAELPMRLGIIAGLASIGRGLRGRFVNRTLPSALRWCWWIALPCVVVAVVLSIGSG